MISQGGRANLSGKNAEAIISCVLHILKKKGYAPVSQHKFEIETTYSDKIIVDFLVRGIPRYEKGLILSSKRQEVSGSADQKIEAHIRMIKEYYPYPTMLILVGEGWRPKIKRWIETQIDSVKLVKVFFSYEKLLRWTEDIPDFDKESSLKFSTAGLPLWDK